MATAGVNGRVSKLVARLDEAVIRYQARQAAREGGAPVAEYEAELRRFYRLAVARLGPRPDHGALAGLLAEQYGGDAAEVYRELRELRAARERRRSGGR